MIIVFDLPEVPLTLLVPMQVINWLQKRVDNHSVLTDGPCIVRVNIFIRSISRIDDVQMEYAIQITFREAWSDDRLVYDDMGGKIRFLTLTETDRIWKPDLFFANEKEGHFHNIIMPNVLLRIYPNGDILFSVRISLVLFCPMNLQYFPLDLQTCKIQMASCKLCVFTSTYFFMRHYYITYYRWLHDWRCSVFMERRRSSPDHFEIELVPFHTTQVLYSILYQ